MINNTRYLFFYIALIIIKDRKKNSCPRSITKASSRKMVKFCQGRVSKVLYSSSFFSLYISGLAESENWGQKRKKKILKKKKVFGGCLMCSLMEKWCGAIWFLSLWPELTKFVQKLWCRFLQSEADIKLVQGWPKKICINRSYLRGQ